MNFRRLPPRPYTPFVLIEAGALALQPDLVTGAHLETQNTATGAFLQALTLQPDA